jgi:hypothetical protein
LQIRSTSHWGTQEVYLACDNDPVRADPMYRKLADNRFEFVRRSKSLHA